MVFLSRVGALPPGVPFRPRLLALPVALYVRDGTEHRGSPGGSHQIPPSPGGSAPYGVLGGWHGPLRASATAAARG